MNLGEHVFNYCERGTDTALWAEPLNAISNAGFFLAALIFWQFLLWRPAEERNADHYLLIALVFLIGGGSLAFHLYANRGTELADVIPIGLFMLVYLGYALNRFLSVPPGWTVFLVVAFAGLMAASAQVHCWEGGIGLAGTVAGSKTCLNGSMSYLPALAAMIVVGMMAAERHHKAAPYILWAAVIFIVSILLRSFDFVFCDQVVIDGRDVGTHFIWHLLNTLVLFLLLRATLETGSKDVPAAPEAAPVPAPVEAVPAEDGPKESPEVASSGEGAAIEAAKAEPEAEPEKEPEPEPEPEPAAPKSEEPKSEESEPEEPEPKEPEEPEDDTGKDEGTQAEDAAAEAPPKKRRSRKKKPSFPA